MQCGMFLAVFYQADLEEKHKEKNIKSINARN